jgi:hypothetical protein
MTSEVMLSYSHGASATPLLGETIGANLRRVAAAYPDAEVLVDVPTSRRWTYAACDAETGPLARGLIAAGPAVGDCLLENWSTTCSPVTPFLPAALSRATWVTVASLRPCAGLVRRTRPPAGRG